MKLTSKYVLLVVVGMGSLSLCAADSKISTEVKAVEKTSVATPVVVDKAKKKTAYFESYSTMRKCEHGEECGKNLQKTNFQLAKGIEEDKDKIAKAEAEFQAKASTLSLAAREKAEKELRKLKVDYSTKLQESEYEMKLAMHTSTEELSRDMEAAVQKIAKKNDYDAVVDTVSGRVLYVKEELNITDEVIKEMNVDYQVKLAKAKNPESTTKLAANVKAPVKKVATAADNNKSVAHKPEVKA